MEPIRLYPFLYSWKRLINKLYFLFFSNTTCNFCFSDELITFHHSLFFHFAGYKFRLVHQCQISHTVLKMNDHCLSTPP